MPENPPQQPEWEERADGSRVRIVDGIRIVDRRDRSERPGPIEHLVARQEDDDGRVVILGLDAECRPVYTTTLQRA